VRELRIDYSFAFSLTRCLWANDRGADGRHDADAHGLTAREQGYRMRLLMITWVLELSHVAGKSRSPRAEAAGSAQGDLFGQHDIPRPSWNRQFPARTESRLTLINRFRSLPRIPISKSTA